jgi:hypothetical protein
VIRHRPRSTVTGLFYRDGVDDYPPRALHVIASKNVCADTINGWLWYCDEHDTHGNADTEAEVRHMADAHIRYFLRLDGEDDDPDACEVIVWMRTKREWTDGDDMTDGL